ncbi:hypothetical protein RV15_GL000332 [Enterococcus silesiacus]|uniref:Uncharacterized protein n=1 Tax=Enterococcus silesiacus TaxID=332949 RepID=A0AA91GB74_9ENTE|nr:hypothetical protein RV15_GL000332 [Enterococcus silesiacus]
MQIKYKEKSQASRLAWLLFLEGISVLNDHFLLLVIHVK